MDSLEQRTKDTENKEDVAHRLVLVALARLSRQTVKMTAVRRTCRLGLVLGIGTGMLVSPEDKLLRDSYHFVSPSSPMENLARQLY